MSDPIRALANFVVLKKGTDRKFVLMLGAGASLASGVKTTATIMEELVDRYPGSQTGSIKDRFDELWRSASRDDRRLMLEPYLKATPSSGYRHLAELIAAGYFDVVITFNFDRLLETALDDFGFRAYQAIVRGETDIAVMARLVEAKEPRVKILKLHGSLHSADYFLFSDEEMLNYPEQIRTMLCELTSRDVIVCGYAFNDRCVVTAFSDSEDAGGIYCVDPAGPGANIKGHLARRRSQNRAIRGEQGRFDEFFQALHAVLLARPAPAATARPRQNLFKFLDHYQEEHKEWFLGRRKLTRALGKRFVAGPPRLQFLYGKPKIGKTSLIRAGLIPNLTASGFDCVYVRCKRDLEPQLRAQVAARFGPDLAALDWDTILTRIKEASAKPLVLFLDQFEKPARAWEESRETKDAIFTFLKGLLGRADERLSIVCVGLQDMAVWKLVGRAKLDVQDEEIEPLSPAKVARIIRFAARQAGTPLPQAVVDDMCDRYRLTLNDASDKRDFTLTHVQTICYYLARGYAREWEGFDRLPNQGLLAALESVRQESSLTDLLDDLPAHERPLIRSFLKVICDPSGNTRKIVEFVRDHFPEIAEDRFPEPLA